MNKKSLLGLLMTGALGAVGCNNGQQNGDNTAGNVTNVTNSTNVTNVTYVESGKGTLPALVKLEPANLDGGDYGLLATFAGDVADLDKRLEGSSFTMSYSGDEYIGVSTSFMGLSEDNITAMLVQRSGGRLSSDGADLHKMYLALNNIINSFMSGFDISEQASLLVDPSYLLGESGEVTLYNVKIDDYYQFVPGVLRSNGIYSFTLNGNFSCDDFSQLFGTYLFSDNYTAGIMAEPYSSDLTDICLADLKDRLQAWLDESLGDGTATILGVASAAYNANGTTAVNILLNNSIPLADDEKISLTDFSAADSDFTLSYYKVYTGDKTIGVKKLVLPANLVKDIDGRPNQEHTFYLAESSFINAIFSAMGGSSSDEESGLILELDENDDGMLSENEEFEVLIPAELVKPASVSVMLIKLFRDAGLKVDSRGADSSYLSFVVLEDTALPLSVNIPAGLFYDVTGQPIPEQTLVFNDVTAPYVVADDNGNTLQVELARLSDGLRGKKLLEKDRIAIKFSEAIDFEKLKTNYDFRKEMRDASGLEDECFDLSYNSNNKEVYYDLNCALDLSAKESLTLKSINAEYVVDTKNGTQENTKIPMAQDAVLSAKVADIFAGRQIEISNSNSSRKNNDRFVAGDYVDWSLPTIYNAEGRGATPMDIIGSISAIKGAEISVGTLDNIKKNIRFIDGKYRLEIPSTGLEIVIDRETVDNTMTSKMQLVFGEGLYDQYGLSMAGSSLTVELILPVQDIIEYNFNLKAYYVKTSGDDSCGRLLRYSAVLVEFSEEDYNAYTILANNYPMFLDEIGKNIAKYISQNTTTDVGDKITVKFSFDYPLMADGILPNGGFMMPFVIDYPVQPLEAEYEYAATLTKDDVLNFKYGTAYNVNIAMPATSAEYTLSTLSGDLHDGLLMPGDLVRASVNCNDNNAINGLMTLVTAGSMVLQNYIDSMLHINSDFIFEYVGDTKDISQGWEIAIDGSTEYAVLKEDLPAAPITFKYLKGSAKGNQAIFQTTSSVDGSYGLDKVFGLDAQEADISFLDGGHAHSLYDISDEPFYMRLWDYLLDF